MKKIYLILILCISSCSHQKKLHYEVKSDPSQKIYVGEVSRNIIENDTLFKWFGVNYKSFNPKNEAIEIIKSKKNLVNYLIFAGTWCGDTKRELPKFYKIVDKCEISDENIILICVDRNKKSLDSLENNFNVKRVPTIIILKNNLEIGRIVERANESLEIDLANILKDLN